MTNKTISNNRDERILKLREVVLKKESELGVEIKPQYKTNLKYENKNILTLDLKGVCELLADCLSRKANLEEASELIGCDIYSEIHDYIHDLTVRGKILSYKEKKKEINKLNKQLDALRSEELRVSDELDDLEKLLK